MITHELDPALALSQRRRHRAHCLYAAACILGVRLARRKPSRVRKSPNYAVRYRVEGVAEPFVGLKPLVAWLKSEGVTTCENSLRKKLTGPTSVAYGFTIHDEGQVRRQISAVVMERKAS